MINQLSKMKLTNPEDRVNNLTIMAKHYEKVEQYSRSNIRVTDNLFKRTMSACMFFAGGGVLTGEFGFMFSCLIIFKSLGIYFMIKIFYLLNAIGQFFLMNYFLNIDYWSYGQKVLYGVFSGRDWLENKVFFPRIVYCDFAIRYLGDNNLNYTV